MFKLVLESSQSFKSKHNIFFRYCRHNGPFIGFMLNTRFGNAVSRNRFKNQSRNLYARLFKDFSCAVIVRPMQNDLKYNDLKCAFFELKAICEGRGE